MESGKVKMENSWSHFQLQIGAIRAPYISRVATFEGFLGEAHPMRPLRLRPLPRLTGNAQMSKVVKVVF